MLNAEKPPRRNRIYGYKKTFRIFSERFYFGNVVDYSETATDTFLCAPSHFTMPSLRANKV